MKKLLAYGAMMFLFLHVVFAADFVGNGVQEENAIVRLHVAPAIAQASPGAYFEQIIEVTNKQAASFSSDLGFLFDDSLKDSQLYREVSYTEQIPKYETRSITTYRLLLANETGIPEGCSAYNSTHASCPTTETYIAGYDTITKYRWEPFTQPTEESKNTYATEQLSFKTGTQRYLIRYLPSKSEGEWFLRIKTTQGELLLDPWFNTTCQKKRNISLTDITGTQTINLTFKGNSHFDPALNHNETNFTFVDASETTKLNFLIDYINSSGNNNQEAQFFVNISNNNSIWMYYDCGFSTPQEDRTTGTAGPVMLGYWNFEDGTQNWVTGGGASCTNANTTATLAHGGLRGKQVLQLRSAASDSDYCRSPQVNIATNLLDSVNIEFLARRDTSSSDWPIVSTSNVSNFTTWTQENIRCALENDADGSDFACNEGSSYVEVRAMDSITIEQFNRYRLVANYSQTDPTLFWNINGTNGNPVSDGFCCSNQGGFKHIRISNRPMDLDEVKIWIQNNATAITISDETIPYANESEGRTAIVDGINGSLSSHTIFTDHIVHLRISNGSQYTGVFDKAVEKGNQFWAFNYVTAGETLTNMPSLPNVFYVWENQSLSISDITRQVGTLINTTKT